MELPRVGFETQRDREQILIDRGEQYQRAIWLYYRKFSRYPQKMDDLEETNNLRFLRKRYKDPLTGKDEWRVVHMGPTGTLADSLVEKPPALNAGSSGSGSGQPAAGQPGDPNQPQELSVAQLRMRESDRNPRAGLGGGAPGPGSDPNQPPDPNQPVDPNNPNRFNPSGNQPSTPGNFGQPGFPPNPNPFAQPNNPSGAPSNSGSNAPPGMFPQPGQPGYGQPGINPGYSLPPGGFPAQSGGFPPGNPGGAPFNPGGNPSGFNPNPTPNSSNPFNQPGGWRPIPSVPQPGAAPTGAAPFNPVQFIQNQLTRPANFGPQGAPGAASGFSTPQSGFGAGGGFGSQPAGSQMGSAGFGGGIAGVATTSKGIGIKRYKDRSKYQEWEFVFDYRKPPKAKANTPGAPGQPSGIQLTGPNSPGTNQPQNQGGFGSNPAFPNPGNPGSNFGTPRR